MNADTVRAACAVEGCDRYGSPRVCLYDEQYHGHGRIHYDSPRAVKSGHGLTFRPDAWRLICAEHYDILRRALVSHERESLQDRTAGGAL